MKSDLISVLMMAFLDLRVFNPNGKVYANIELSKAYGINKKKGKERNNERILLIERGSFTPLVMLHLEIK